MKRIIWSNLNLDINDWKDEYKEWVECNKLDRDPNDEDGIYDYMIQSNNDIFDIEKMNLNHKVDGRILVIADLGLWNGRHSAYVIRSNTMNDIFNINGRGFDYAEFYGDGYNIRGVEHHHDGTNYYLYRIIREDRNIENLLDSIYNGEEISRSKLNYYTKSLYKDVAAVYGWR